MLLLALSSLFATTALAADLISCLNTADLEIVTPTTYGYCQASTPFNLRFHVEPTAIVYPKTSADVSHAIKCASSNGIMVSARSGGHSYNAYGLGSEDGFLVLDLVNFNKVTFDEKGEIATVGTGLRLGNVALGLYNQKQRAIPHGVCPQVGVGGHAGCGGFGLTSRQWGLNADAMVGAEVVLADGSIHHVSKDSDPDIFWAIRGAGPSFGISTAYKYKTLPAPPITTYYHYYFAGDSPAVVADALLAIQEFALTVDFSASIRLVVNNRNSTWYLTGSYPGKSYELEQGLGPLLDKLPEPIETDVHEYGWPEFLQSLSDNEGLGPLNASSVPQPRDNFYAKSVVIPDYAPLSDKAALDFFTYLFSKPATQKDISYWFIEADLYGGVGSAIPKIAPDATAYGNREGLFTFQLYASMGGKTTAPFPDAGFQFLDDMADTLTAGRSPEDTWHFPCYPDARLSSDEWHKYYSGNYDRLVELKDELDPTRVFGYAQAIGTAAAKIPFAGSDMGTRLDQVILT